MGLISCKLLRFLFMFSIAFTSFSVLPPFPFDSLYQPICQYICGDFNLHHNEWLILVGLIKLACNISVSKMLLRCLTFLLRPLTVTHNPALSDVFLYFDSSIYSTVAFSPLRNVVIMLLS